MPLEFDFELSPEMLARLASVVTPEARAQMVNARAEDQRETYRKQQAIFAAARSRQAANPPSDPPRVATSIAFASTEENKMSASAYLESTRIIQAGIRAELDEMKKKEQDERVRDLRQAGREAEKTPKTEDALRQMKDASEAGDGGEEDARRFLEMVDREEEKDEKERQKQARRAKMTQSERDALDRQDRAMAAQFGCAPRPDFSSHQRGTALMMSAIAPTPAEAARLLRLRGGR